MKAFIGSLIALSICASSFAQDIDTTLPDIVANGVKALKETNASAAIDVWLKGSPIENDTTGRGKILGGLSTIEGLYGKSTGFDVVEVFPVTPTTVRVYGVVRYEKGPLYARWDCFKTPSGWIIPEFFFNTTAEQVFPAALLYKK